MCQYCVHAGHAKGLADVDRKHACMCVRTPHRVPPEHSGRLQIARVRELPGCLRDPVGPADDLADPPELELPRGCAHARVAAIRTASKIFA